MKRYSTALLFGLLSLSSQLAHADVIDDAIGSRRSTMPITPAAAAATMMTIVMTMTDALIAVSMTTAVGSLKTDAAV